LPHQSAFGEYIFQVIRASFLILIMSALISLACKAKEVATSASPDAVILCFHDIGREGRYAISEEDFTEILALLKGYAVTSLRDWLNAAIIAKPHVVLTFDDGYAAHREIVLPHLARRGYGATFFFYTDQLKSDKKWQRLVRQKPSQFEFGSHSWSHRSMTEMPNDEMFRELYLARTFMENLTHETMTAFAWPYGAYDESGIAAAKNSGFQVQVSVDYRIAKSTDRNRVIPRFTVMGNNPVKQVREILRKYESDRERLR